MYKSSHFLTIFKSRSIKHLFGIVGGIKELLINKS